MNIKPSGTVTFLFTDIEGSTKLSQEFPEKYQDALNRHNSILKYSVEANKGFVFEIIGDAFCCAFENAGDAISAAIDIQLNLKKENWDEVKIKVRVGIHTGKAEWNGNNYMGYITLARTARIISAAYGEQVLISNDVYISVIENSTSINSVSETENRIKEILFSDLGERRLKDLIQPIRLFQINSPGMRSDFPPLKTLDARPNNLPIQLTNFIGREKEIADVKKKLSDTRLLTLIGPGGTGKTRLSLQIAADMIDSFSNGVWLVELAPLIDPVLIPTAIARSLGINEQPFQDIEQTLINNLKEKEVLIILDNCEHLIDASAAVTEKLLQNCSKLKIIATSRETLRCKGEKTHRVLSLAHPDPNQNNTPLVLSQFEAVRLFIERALSVNSNFRITNENAPAVAQICYQLDGIPLAVELAAARIKVLSVEKICEKLNDRFRLLTGGKRTALPRQQTLKAMIDWSYNLLTENEKILIQRLSVFTGGWTFEAAEEICADEKIDIYEILDTHTNLLDKSLINTTEKSGAIRFHLMETVKQYAKEKLGNDNNIKHRHFNYFSRIADLEQMNLQGIDQFEWVNLIDSELDNLRTAVQWASENDQEEACNLISGLSEFWEIKGYLLEGIQTCTKILNSKILTDEYQKAKILYIAGLIFQSIGNSAEAEKNIEECLFIFRKLNSKVDIAKSLNVAGQISYSFKTNYTLAENYYNQAISIFREYADKRGIATSLYLLSFPVHIKGNSELALKYKKEALEIFKELDDVHQISLIQASLGIFELKRNDFESAKYYSEESLTVSTKFGNKYLISINLINLGCVYTELKQYDKARDMLEESLIIIKECGYISSLLVAQMYLGDIESGSGNYEKAIIFYKESIQTGSNAGISFFLSTNIYKIGISYYNLKDFEKSLTYFSFLKKIITDKGDPLGTANISSMENFKNMIRNNLDGEKYDRIIKDALKFSKEEIVNIVLNNN